MLKRIALAMLAGLSSLSMTANAQTLPAGATPVPPAEFYRVDEGVFALRPGMSIDLTDRKILLTFRTGWQWSGRNPERFYIILNGSNEVVEAGKRIDLKRERATAGSVSDKDTCVLDVISFVVPKGAPPTATFRLNCI